MLVLSENNVIEYVKHNTKLLDGAQNITARAFDNTGSESGSGDGYINFVFCVEFSVDGNEKSIVVKQARPYSKHIPVNVPTSRNKIEYQTIRLKAALIPEYLPKLYFIDEQNSVFIMESFINFSILRYRFNKMEKIEGLSQKIAEFLAVSNFYTSEIYLETCVFRNLQASFLNCQMRQILENGIFIPEFAPLGEKFSEEQDPELYAISRNIWEDKETAAQCYVMRDIFMHRGECLVHGDFHTSNIFVKDDKMKVIDMEYTFMGPYSYDLGYLFNNYISQYSACKFKTHESGKKAEDFAEYILQCISDIYTAYVEKFDSLWEYFGKETYRYSKEYRKEIYLNLLQEMLGFAAVANISRITVFTSFPDFDVITDRKRHLHAKRLSLVISQHLLKNRKSYSDIANVLKDIRKISQIYMSRIGDV